MKIKSLKFINHPSLGDLTLDFTIGKNQVADTVIFAGENGCCKTITLQSICKILENHSMFKFKIVTQNDGSDVEFDGVKTNNQFYRMIYGKNPNFSFNSHLVFIDAGFINNSSPVGTFSVTEPINGYPYKSPISNNPEDINNLIANLGIIDNNEAYQDFLMAAPDEKVEDLREKNSKNRMAKFSRAFKKIFSDLKYINVRQNSNGHYFINFAKNKKTFSIVSLSSGEKQIVYRSTFLLNGIDAIKNKDTFVFVDEPEISLHPKWQRKIVNFYQSMFSDDKKHDQFAQMFFATHSENVVKAALKDPKCLVIIMKREKDGSIKAIHCDKNSFYLPSLLSSEVNYFAFDLITVDYHINLFSYLQDILKDKGICNDKICSVDDYIADTSIYKQYSKDNKLESSYSNNEGKHEVKTLCTYIRNAIDHPESYPGVVFNESTLRLSIEILQKVIKELK